MREPGTPPNFGRLINEIERARNMWILGDTKRAEAILKLVGSLAYSEAGERGPNDPVPE